LAEDGAIICPGCDFILDASFLGDDITDDERDRRPRRRASGRPAKGTAGPAHVDFGEDAMILGNVDDVEVSSFNSRDAGLSQREVTQTRFYIGGAVAQLMEPNAIPEIAAGVSGASIRMTPFERHVLGFVNGRRSIGRIQKKSAMEESEFKTAIAMLADKGFIRLKGWKKPRSSGGSSIGVAAGASMTGSAVRPKPAPPREAERTVVASMAHIEAAAARLAEARQAPRPATRAARAPVPEPVSAIDTPPSPMPVAPAATDTGSQTGEVATRIVEVPTASRPAALPSRRFASLQAEVPPSSDAPPPAPAVAPADDAWGADDNQSSVFADSGAAPRPHRPPSLADVDAEADAFASGQTGAIEAFRDPTGLGDDLEGDDAPPGSDGAPIDDDGEPPFASAEALSEERADDDQHDDADDDHNDDASASASAGDDDDDDLVGPTDHDIGDALGPARRIHDEVTAAPARREASLVDRVEDDAADDDDARPDDADAAEADGFDDGFQAQPTGHLPRPMTLPSSAMQPVVVEPPPSPTTAPLPSMTVAPVAAVRPTPTPPTPPLARVEAPPLALPGQAILKPGDAGFAPPPAAAPLAAPATTSKPQVATARVSAASQVPFELRKKAERIYEQALKDQAEGRISSAMMNARLAMNFDPTVDAYRELHEDLARQKSAPKGGPRPQELVLFEQASEAEGKGDYQKAVKLLEQAIAINPRAGALYNRLGVVLSIRLKRHEEALAHLKKAIELEPGSLVYMNNFSKVTGLLESLIEKGPRKKEKGSPQDERVAVKKIRPKMF
jgi:hypothetical protein